MTGVRERVTDAVANPYLVLLTRAAMIFITFIAAPVIYWMVSTLLNVNNNLSTIVLIQKMQQDQVQQTMSNQSSLLNSQAAEAQTRAVTDAQLTEQMKNMREELDRTSRHLESQDRRLDALSSNVRRP